MVCAVAGLSITLCCHRLTASTLLGGYVGEDDPGDTPWSVSGCGGAVVCLLPVRALLTKLAMAGGVCQRLADHAWRTASPLREA